MDVLMPFLQRTPGTPIEQDPRLVLPVFKDARLTPLNKYEQKYLILQRVSKRKKGDDNYPPAPYTTPEEELHVDKDGHLDIFV